MNYKHLVSAAAAVLFSAASAHAQSSDQDWGDGAAFGGGILKSSGEMLITRKAETPRVAGSILNSPKLPRTPSGLAGECAARITIPARYRTDQRQVIVQDAHTKLAFSEPALHSDTVRVKVRDEYTRYKVRQPRWEVETEEIVARPEYERLTVRPAQWKFIDETVDISQPRLVWKRGNVAGSQITRTDPVTGSVFTLLEEPGETRTYRKRVMLAPEQVVATRVPAKSLTVTRRVLTDPGGVDAETVPAEFRNYAVEKITQPAMAREIPVPAKRELISTDIMVSPERWEWVPVLCAEDLNVATIRDMQSRLASNQFYDGASDGVFGPQTRRALKAYQESQGYSHSGELSLVTLDKLGVSVSN